MARLTATQHFIELSVTFSGFLGLLLILYGAVAEYYQAPWPLLDAIAEWTANTVTLVAVVVLAGSLYFPVHSRRPDPVTTAYFAPALLVLVAIATYFLTTTWHPLPPHVVNGFAILGLAGAVLRTLPFSSGD